MEVSCPFAQDTGYCHFAPRTSEAETQLNRDSRVYMHNEHFVILYPRPLAQRHILGLDMTLIGICWYQRWSCKLGALVQASRSSAVSRLIFMPWIGSLRCPSSCLALYLNLMPLVKTGLAGFPVLALAYRQPCLPARGPHHKHKEMIVPRLASTLLLAARLPCPEFSRSRKESGCWGGHLQRPPDWVYGKSQGPRRDEVSSGRWAWVSRLHRKEICLVVISSEREGAV